MTNDEQSIRGLVEQWHRFTAAGDVSAILRLIADDAVFLTPGQPPMGKEGFEKGLRTLLEHHSIKSTYEIAEIKIFGDWAYCWNYLSVTITSFEGGSSKRRTGDALSILHKDSDGNWILFRDANLLAEEPTKA